MSLQKLVQETEYPPERPSLLQSSTTKVVMIVDSVSPTPFALLRRANHFQYRDDDRALQEFSEYEDPVKALTDECRRVLNSISSANQSQVSSAKDPTGLPEAWSRFEDIGFSGTFDEKEEEDDDGNIVKRRPQGLKSAPQSRSVGSGRPTTPSWADFLSSGFADDEGLSGPAPLLLPPDKILPPIDINNRGRSSQSHRPRLESEKNLEPGELASITRLDLDDSFWWVWISSLAGEEPAQRKAAFGRCALIETVIPQGRWLVMEEMVKGAAPKPDPNAYIAEKKSFWGRSRKNKGITRSKSTGKQALLDPAQNGRFNQQQQGQSAASKTSIGPDQHARIQAAAIQLQKRERELAEKTQENARRGRNNSDTATQNTSSVFTLQPVIMSEASPAMKWASKYDKDTIREAYLSNSSTGRGASGATTQTNGAAKSQDTSKPAQSQQQTKPQERDLPAIPSPPAAPAVPSKTPTTPPAKLPPTPTADQDEEHIILSEKATEVEFPQDPHPIDRKAVPTSSSPVPPVEVRSETPRPSVDQSGSSPESKKHNRLKKRDPASGGFRKMFGRNKNREYQPSENAPETLNGSQGLQPGGASIGRRFSSFRKRSPVSSQTDASPNLAPSPAPISEDDITPVPTSHQNYNPSYEPSLHSMSRVDTNDADEAHHEFSKFDQGPLEDVPAFVPDSPKLSEESVTPVPPPVTKKTLNIDDESTKDLPPALARWAQIKKNAAERAARQSDEQSGGTYSQKTDGDDGDTSGEESKQL
jgi:hypothetical protein